MFYNCTSLTSLDLSGFDTSKVTYIQSMFYNCINLEYINLNNFYENILEYYETIFYNVSENVVICIKENNNQKKIIPQINNKTCHKIDCSDNVEFKPKKIFDNNTICVVFKYLMDIIMIKTFLYIRNVMIPVKHVKYKEIK